MLRSVLQKHPQLHCFPEVFHTDYGARAQFPDAYPTHYEEYHLACVRADPDAALLARRPEQVGGYLAEIERWAEAAGTGALIDVKYNSVHQADPTWRMPTEVPEMLRIFADRGYRVIHLKRRDVLGMTTSLFRGGLTGQFGAVSTDEIKRVTFRINPSDYLRTLRYLVEGEAAIDGWLGDLEARCYDLYYESLFSGAPGSPFAPATFAALGRFLDLSMDGLDLTPAYKKLAPRSMRDEVENHDELIAAVRASPWGDRAALTG